MRTYFLLLLILITLNIFLKINIVKSQKHNDDNDDEEEEDLGEIPSDQSNVKFEDVEAKSSSTNNNKSTQKHNNDDDEEEDLGEIPSDQSNVKFTDNENEAPDASGSKDIQKRGKNNLAKMSTSYNEDYDNEDSVARYAFTLILVILLVFMILFVYNLLKCYWKAPSQKNVEMTRSSHYNREVGNIHDDTVLDLGHI